MRWLSVVVWLMVVALLVLRSLASIHEVGSGAAIRAGPEGSDVAGVQVGGLAWLLGISPGDAYIPWPDGGGGLVVGSTREVELADTLPAFAWWPVVAALVALVVAFLARSGAPSLGQVAMVGAAVLLAWELYGAAVMPFAVVVIAIPTLVLGIRWLLGVSGGRHRVALVIATTAAVALEAGAVAAANRSTWRTVWAGATLTPAILVVGGAAITWVLAVRRDMSSQRAAGGSITAAMVESTAAGRTALWTASERWRDDRAHWIHDTVLPQLATGIHDIESGQDASGSSVLHELAEGLRKDLEADQLTVLRIGGLRPALDGALDAARDEGLMCDLAVDAEGDAPPWPVVVAAWRVAQEAISNARRHSGADRISVTARERHDHLTLDVSDDGVGLTEEDLSRRHGHIGLQSMTDTAGAVHATVRFLPSPPTGLLVRFEWGR